LTRTGKAIKGAADRTAKNIRDTADDVTVRTIAVVKTVVPVATDALNVILPKYEPLPHDTFLSLAFACSIPYVMHACFFRVLVRELSSYPQFVFRLYID